MAAGPDNTPFTVVNNIIANNVATHEGGGVAIDDTPNVRFVNNTVVRNLTTATAITSNGQPAPAGLSTGGNSALLQQALNAKYGLAAPRFSDPVILNDVFLDNRAGTWTSDGVIGIGAPGDATPPNLWDIGAADSTGRLTPHSSVFNSIQGSFDADSTNTVLPSPTAVSDVGFRALWDLGVDTAPLRTNPQFRQALIVTVNAPIGTMGDYHLDETRPAVDPLVDQGAAEQDGLSPAYELNPPTLAAPSSDIDGDHRPNGPAWDIGADEIAGGQAIVADVSVTKVVDRRSVRTGVTVHFLVQVHNNGPDAASGVAVSDIVPTGLSGVTWGCSAMTGSSCPGGSGTATGTGTIDGTVDLAPDGTVSFLITARVSATEGSVTNTVTVTPPPEVTDSNLGNNTASATVIVAPPRPRFGLLDNFNRGDAVNLGSKWSQLKSIPAGIAAIRIDNRRAQAEGSGVAIWNGPPPPADSPVFGSRQGAAFAFIGTPLNNTCLILKATGGTTVAAPANFIRACYLTASGSNPARVQISTTTNGLTFTNRGAALPIGFVNGDQFTVQADPDGTVYAWRNRGGNTTLIGAVAIPISGPGAWLPGAGGGRIGIQLPAGAVVDNFRGGTL